MTVSAHDVARALRERLPGLGKLQLQKLLYYCQGHHLAAIGQPLFHESISAWDNGPVVGQLWWVEENDQPRPPAMALTEGQLNTVGYVCSRYGALTAYDLVNMTHGEPPWQQADQDRSPGSRVRIELDWMQEFFSTAGAADAKDDAGPPVDPSAVKELLARGELQRASAARPDSVDSILERIRRLSA